MDEIQRIAVWLHVRNHSTARFYLFGAAGMFLVGVIALLVTWWGFYLILWFGFSWLIELNPLTRMLVAAVLVALLFPINAWTDRRELETFRFTTGISSSQPVSIFIPGVGLGSTINPLAPDSLGSFVKAIALLLFFGPRFVSAAFQMLALARRLWAMDVEGAASVLAYLVGRDKRAPFKNIVRAILPGHEIQTILTQLRDVDGVLYLLQSEPPGMSLSTELRGELREVLRSMED